MSSISFDLSVGPAVIIGVVSGEAVIILQDQMSSNAPWRQEFYDATRPSLNEATRPLYGKNQNKENSFAITAGLSGLS